MMDFAPYKKQWDVDGWCVLPAVLDEEALAGAQRALGHLFPSAQEMAERNDRGEKATWDTWDAKWPEFPFQSRSLNKLVVDDTLLELAGEFLGTTDLRCYMALVTAKYPGQSSEFNQLLHTDFPNHTITVPRRDPGYQQLETYLYLVDVDEHNGATRFVSRTLTADIPVERHTLSFAEYPHLYEEPGVAAGPPGSIVCYRPDVYHRSVDVMEPRTARFMLHVSFRPARLEWGSYQAWAFKGFSMEWVNFVASCTPRQLSLFGFPAPGDPFWTPETIDGVAKRYPGLDVTPWQKALTRASKG
jgi:hypothetical protein